MTNEISHDPAESRKRIEEAASSFPTLSERIYRTLLITLHRRGIVSIDEIYAQARGKAQRDMNALPDLEDENVQVAERWDALEREFIREATVSRAAENLTPEQIDDVVLLTRKREEAQSLEEIASLSTLSFRLLADGVKRFCRLPRGHSRLSERESLAARVALIRHFISDQLEFIGIAKSYLTIRHFDDLVDRIVGEDSGLGRIGGKAAGMLLANAILEKAREEDPSAPDVPIAMPESFYLRADVMEEYLRHQGLLELQNHKYKDPEEIRNEYSMLLQVFKNADFPRAIIDQIKEKLEEIGEAPLIVRSSSLLEDRFGATFAGKYRSVFVANQGPLEQRLTDLMGAIAEVYASTLHPDPISYRQRHNLLDYDEKMAVMVQKVVGARYGDYFLPVWAGVAFSRNDYRRNPRIRPEDGLARLVVGLGTRAVDRTADDYPRMMALGQPTLRELVKPQEIVRFSQRHVDAINLVENRLETVPLSDLVENTGRVPGLEQALSIYQDGLLRTPTGTLLMASSDDLVVTFDRFATDSPYPRLLKWILNRLEQAYGCPVDIEFAFDGERFYLLQCRPQAQRRTSSTARLPSNVPDEDKIFSSTHEVARGAAHGIEYVVLVDPKDYDRLPSNDERIRVADVIRKLNHRLSKRRFVLMGPGRWGTKDPRMGIRVTYAGIHNTRALIEIARAKGGYVPEVSFGSHFFQDLVESDILYLALYPDDRENVFNEDFLHGSPNEVTEIEPAARGLEHVVRVIHVPSVAGGRKLNIDMDDERQLALGYLASP
jgi:hypothetical protein